MADQSPIPPGSGEANNAANPPAAQDSSTVTTGAQSTVSAMPPAPADDKNIDSIIQGATFEDADGASRQAADGKSAETEAAENVPPDSEAIEKLLQQVSDAQATLDSVNGGEPSIEELLKQANFEDASDVVGAEAPGSDAEAFRLPSFQQVMADAQVSSIDLLRDVELNVKIELGRSRMLVEDVLKLSEGSVVELDKLAGDPVDVFVNERLVARGEVLVLNDNFCVRVNEIVAGVKEEVM
jgi:flagellar motor switch protein FliN/FliY